MPELPAQYGKYKLMVPVSGGCMNTLKKYGKALTTDVDEDAFLHSGEIFRSRHKDVFGQKYGPLTFEQATYQLELAKSPGPVAKMLGISRKGTFLKEYYHQIKWCVMMAVELGLIPLCKNSQKTEVLDISKFYDILGNLDVRPRLFWIFDLWFIILQIMHFAAMMEAWKAKCRDFDNRTRVSFPMQSSGFHTMYSDLDEYPNVVSDDIKGYDSSIWRRLSKDVYDIMAECSTCSDSQSIYDYLHKRTYDERYCVTDTGLVFIAEQSNPSGGFRTTVDGDMIKERAQDYAITRYIRDHVLDGELYYPYYNNSDFFINNFNDDGVSGFYGPFAKFAKYETRRKYFAELGITIDPEKDEVSTTAEGIKFLGARAVRTEYGLQALYDEDKLVATFQQQAVPWEREKMRVLAYCLLTAFGDSFVIWSTILERLGEEVPSRESIKQWWAGLESPGLEETVRRACAGFKMCDCNGSRNNGNVGECRSAAPSSVFSSTQLHEKDGSGQASPQCSIPRVPWSIFSFLRWQTSQEECESCCQKCGGESIGDIEDRAQKRISGAEVVARRAVGDEHQSAKRARAYTCVQDHDGQEVCYQTSDKGGEAPQERTPQAAAAADVEEDVRPGCE